jgi:hypothetical protein
MSIQFEYPDWLPREPIPTPPPVDDHHVEGLVNRFIAAKQEALFAAPDAFYRLEGGDALEAQPALAQRLQDMRTATLDLARDDGERTALGPRLDAHIDEAMDGIGRHVEAQRTVFQRRTLAERQALIRRAAELEHDNDGKVAGLAEAHASAAQELARLDGIAPEAPDEANRLNAARSQIFSTAISQRIAAAKPAQAIALYERVKARLSPADRHALEMPIGAAADDAATDAWLEREASKDGAPLVERAGLDDTLSAQQRLVLQAKIAARDSAEESQRIATVKGLDDQRDAATATIATQPALYKTGTLAMIANAYDDAGAPEQAAEARQLALLEPFFRPFAQLNAAAQQRHLDTLTGPERAFAEAITRHQADAFARDPYAAGTKLYPVVGPPLPDKDTDGRLTQVRMIEARRGTSESPDAASGKSVQLGTAASGHSDLPQRDRVWADGQSPPQSPDPNLVPVADGPAAGPQDGEGHGDVELAQAPSKPNPSTGPTRPPGSPNPAGPSPASPAAPGQSRPLTRQEQAVTNRTEIDRLANKPAADYPSEKSFPADWEKLLPQTTLEAVNREAKAFSVPPELLARIMWKESKFKEDAGVKENYPGQGIAGITNRFAAQQLWDNWLAAAKRDPNNGVASGELEMAAGRLLANMRLKAAPAIRMEAEYLRYLYDKTGHSWPVAVAAYKHGETVIRAFLNGDRTTKSIPDWGQVQAYLGLVFDGDAKRFDTYK